MKTREIPIKNYVVVTVVSLITIVLTFTLMTNYKNQMKYENENIMTTFLSEIRLEELGPYITENHDVMIYLIQSNEIDEIQKQAKNIIMKNDFTNDMIVLNINVDENLILELKKTYFSDLLKDTDLKENDILFVKEGKIVDLLNVNMTSIKTLKHDINTIFYGAL